MSRFTHNNLPFRCEVCLLEIPPLPVGCRNHCPNCLVSKHVDIFPGDRANPCQGLMDAVDYEISSKKGLVLIFRCRSCGGLGRNVAAHEAEVAPDNYLRILGLKQFSS